MGDKNSLSARPMAEAVREHHTAQGEAASTCASVSTHSDGVKFPEVTMYSVSSEIQVSRHPPSTL